ncbi:hypothetical protein Pmani_005572 [Petrolisthes manimaculis]|uniref:Structure-specific endonuclease subunit SLX4 n=1 Tax=Petrolisthes manimaculis TaxID=1843537 RepID=A0AAE1QCP8_9EUCA|nr:hypothetical protein Pmani_005572 [Petrolisthes manimaculis]
MSGKSRLSRKRKPDGDQSQVSSIHDLTDDFQDADTVFRLPKKSRTACEKPPTSSRTRGRPKKTEIRVDTQLSSLTTHNLQAKATLNSQTEKEDASSLLDDDGSSSDKQDCTYRYTKKKDGISSKVQSSYPISQKENPIENEEDDSCMVLMEIEKSLCSEDEKLCPCCKIIIPCALFTEHFKVCLHKFQLLPKKGSNKETAHQSNGEEEGEKRECLEEKQQQSGDLPSVLPCPVCFKSFKSRVQRISHMKSCAHSHGMTVEQLLLAIRLVEKQAEERSALGLPALPQHSDSDTRRSTGTERTAKVRLSRKRTKENDDPDVAMALALSRSLAEEEAQTRIETEKKLLALGLDNIVEEDRKTRPILALPSAPDPTKPSKNKARGKKYKNSLLATRPKEERERLVSEKVATLLTEEEHLPTSHWTTNKTSSERSNKRLTKFQDKTNNVWEATHSGSDQSQDHFYVSELSTYIQPREIAVGGLLRRLSQVPGRLNLTSLRNTEDESGESEGEEDEATVIDGYCTQLALAGLLGSQDTFDMTVDLAVTEKNLPDSVHVTSNTTFKAGQGFWQPDTPCSEGKPHCRDSNGGNTVCYDQTATRTQGMGNDGEDVNIDCKTDKEMKNILPPSYENLFCSSNTETGCTKNEVDDISQNTHASEIGTRLNLNDSQTKNSDSKLITQGVMDKNKNSNNRKRGNSLAESEEHMSDCEVVEIVGKNNESAALAGCSVQLNESTVHLEMDVTNIFRDNRDADFRGATDLDNNQVCSDAVANSSHHSEDSNSTQIFGDINDDNAASCSSNSHTTVIFSEDQNLVCSPLSIVKVGKNYQINCQTSQSQQFKEKNGEGEYLLETVGQQRENNNGKKKRWRRESESENNISKGQELKSKDKRGKDRKINNDKEKAKYDIREGIGKESFNETNEMPRSKDKIRESKETNNGRSEEPLPCESERLLVDSRTIMLDKLSDAWGGLLARREHCDVVVTTSNEFNHSVHSLVLLARCPSLYREAVSAGMHVGWNEVSQEAAHMFIHYLYTGKCQVETKEDPLLMDVYDLGLRYSCKDLVRFLEAVLKADQSVTQQSNVICPEAYKKTIESPQKISKLLRNSSVLLGRNLESSRKNSESSSNHLESPSKKLESPRKMSKSPNYHSESLKIQLESPRKNAELQRKASISPNNTTTMLQNLQELPQISDTPVKKEMPKRTIEVCKKRVEFPQKNKPKDFFKNAADFSQKKTDSDLLTTVSKSLTMTCDKEQEQYPGEEMSYSHPLTAFNRTDEGTVHMATPPKKTSPCKPTSTVEKINEYHGSQSPDLFDMDDGNCSFISIPPKSPVMFLANTNHRDHILDSPRGKDVSPSSSVMTNQLSPSSTVSFQASPSNKTVWQDKRTSPSFSSVNYTHKGCVSDLTRNELQMPCKSISSSSKLGDTDQHSSCTNVSCPASPSNSQATLSFTVTPQKDPAFHSIHEFQTPYKSVSSSSGISITDQHSPCSTVDFHASPSEKIVQQNEISPVMLSQFNSPQRNCFSDLSHDGFITPQKSFNQEHASLFNRITRKKSDQQPLVKKAVGSEDMTDKVESSENESKQCVTPPLVKDKAGYDTIDLTLSDAEDSNTIIESSQHQVRSEGMDMASTSTFKVSDVTYNKEKENVCQGNKNVPSQLQKSTKQMENLPEVLEKSPKEIRDPECSEIEHISSVWDDFDDVAGPMFTYCSPSPVKSNHFVDSCNAKKLSSDNISQNHNLFSKHSNVDKSQCVSSSLEDTSVSRGIPGCKSPLHVSPPLKSSFANKNSSVQSNIRISAISKASQQESGFPEKSRNSLMKASCPGDNTLAEAAAELECSVILKEFEMNEEICQKQSLDQEEYEEVNRDCEDLLTPQGKKGRVSNTVTPMPQYRTMTSPQLKKELERYGVRPIGRRKALMLLQHLYDQTHPQVTDSEAETTFSETPQHKSLPTHTEMHTTAEEGKKRKGQGVTKGKKKIIPDSGKCKRIQESTKERNSRKEKDLAEEEGESDQLNSSQNSTTSTECSSSECFEETLGLEYQHDHPITQTQQVSLVSQVTEFITNDLELHQKVLLYQPFFIEELQATLKMNGIKCKMNALMDVLDEQCITFRTQAGQKTRTRKRKRNAPPKARRSSGNDK